MAEEYSDVKYFRIGKVDDWGIVVGSWEIEPDKLPYDYIKYCYDEQGRVVRFEKHERDFPEKPFFRTYKYKEDSKSPYESEWFDRYGSFVGLHRYYCDEKGLLYKRDETDGARKVKYYILSKYDEQNRLIEEAWYDSDDMLDKKDLFTYESPETSHLTPTTEAKYDENDELTGTFHFTWDERNNVVLKKWHNREGVLQSYYTHEHDENDLLTGLSLYHEDDSLQLSYKYTYDDVGNKILEECFDGEGNLVKGQKWEGVFLEKKEEEKFTDETTESKVDTI